MSDANDQLTSRIGVVDAFRTAVSHPSDATTAALVEHLADKVIYRSPFGSGEGREAVLEWVGSPRLSGFLGAAEWSPPTSEGDALITKATVGPTLPIGGFAFAFFFDSDERISRIEQDTLAHGRTEPAPLKLTDDIKTAINNAVVDHRSMVLAYVDAEGQPHLSFRGSTQPYGDDQLAIWVRDPNGGLVRALGSNSRVALIYGTPPGMMYEFRGRARVESSEEVLEHVYSHSDPAEQDRDWRRKGVAVIVDLDRVDGIGMPGRVVMARQAGGEVDA